MEEEGFLGLEQVVEICHFEIQKVEKMTNIEHSKRKCSIYLTLILILNYY